MKRQGTDWACLAVWLGGLTFCASTWGAVIATAAWLVNQ